MQRDGQKRNTWGHGSILVCITLPRSSEIIPHASFFPPSTVTSVILASVAEELIPFCKNWSFSSPPGASKSVSPVSTFKTLMRLLRASNKYGAFFKPPSRCRKKKDVSVLGSIPVNSVLYRHFYSLNQGWHSGVCPHVVVVFRKSCDHEQDGVKW